MIRESKMSKNSVKMVIHSLSKLEKLQFINLDFK